LIVYLAKGSEDDIGHHEAYNSAKRYRIINSPEIGPDVSAKPS
jgi:hypothetical protein